MDLQKIGWGMHWIDLAQDRDSWRALVNTVLNLWAPYNAGNFLTSCEPVSFSRKIVLRGVSNWVSKQVRFSYLCSVPHSAALNTRGICHVVRRAYLFSIEVSPCLALSAIVSQLFSPGNHLHNCGCQHFDSALETDVFHKLNAKLSNFLTDIP